MDCTGGRCGETILDIGDSPRIFQCFFPAVDVIYLNYFCCLYLFSLLHGHCMIVLYYSVTLLDTISLIVTLLCFIVTRKKGSEEGSEWVSEWVRQRRSLSLEEGKWRWKVGVCVSLSKCWWCWLYVSLRAFRSAPAVVSRWVSEWVSDGVIIATVLMSLIYFSGCKASPIIFVKRKV